MPIDIWSLVTGLLSIIAFAFTIPEKFSHWRKYFIPFSWASLGYVVGRLHIMFSPSASSAFQDPILIGLLAILAICFSLLYFTMKTIRDVSYGFFGFLIICILIAMTSVSSSYLTSKRQLLAPELIEFASYKESRGEYAMAAHYLSIAATSISNFEQKKAIESKITELSKRQLGLKVQAGPSQASKP